MNRILLIAAVVHAGLGAWMLVSPSTLRAGVRALPRHRVAGYLLLAVALYWSYRIVSGAELGGFNGYKPMLPYVGVLAFGLIAWQLEELLATRALGGLLALVANPVLATVRFHSSTGGLLIAAECYMWVVAAMYLIASPYHFRRWLEPVMAQDRRIRFAGVILLVLAGFHAYGGLFIFV